MKSIKFLLHYNFSGTSLAKDTENLGSIIELIKFFTQQRSPIYYNYLQSVLMDISTIGQWNSRLNIVVSWNKNLD